MELGDIFSFWHIAGVAVSAVMLWPLMSIGLWLSMETAVYYTGHTIWVVATTSTSGVVLLAFHQRAVIGLGIAILAALLTMRAEIPVAYARLKRERAATLHRQP